MTAPAAHAAAWSGKPAAKLTVVGFKPMRRSTLRGVVTVHLGSRLRLLDCPVLVHPNGRNWAALPGRPLLDEDGRHKREVNGKPTLLRARFPAAFCLPPRPLAIGVGKQIEETLGPSPELPRALAYWVHRASYGAALVEGGHRYGLDGEVAGTITEEHRALARASFAKPRKRNNGGAP